MQLTKLGQNKFVLADDGVKIAVRQDPDIFLLFDLLLCTGHTNDQEAGKEEGKRVHVTWRAA